MVSPRPYVFFFPYRGVGGVPVLFLRIAQWMAEHTNNPIYLIDYSDGYMAKATKNSKIQVLTYIPEIKIKIPPNAILIFQSDLPWGLPQNFIVEDSVTAFFWNCYPFNLVPVLPGAAREWMSKSILRTQLLLNTVLWPAKLQCRNFLKNLIENRAIAFMDFPNLDLSEKALNFKIKNPTYLPILLPDTQSRSKRTVNNGTVLSGAWVGRIADFKVYSLAYVLQKTQSWCDRTQTHFNFNIVGDGDRIPELKSLLKKSQFLNINFLGSMSPDKLEVFLTNEVDILFAMGTSALEGARLAIPTILLDFSYGEFPITYKFKWLYDTNHYSLGAPVDSFDFFSGENIETIIQEFIGDSSIGKKCRKYFEEHHTLESNAPLFMELASKSSFCYQDFLNKKICQKPAYYKVRNLLKTIS